MIKVFKVQCKQSIDFGKSGACVKGEVYLARLSKKGDSVLVLTNKNCWTVMLDRSYAYRFIKGDYKHYFPREFYEYFQELCTIYFSNRREIRKLDINNFNK